MENIIEVVVRWVHVGAAAYWLVAGFYVWQTMRAELQIDGATFTSYSAQMLRVSKLGKGMAISSGLTVVAGLVLYGLLRYWTRGFATLGPIVFNIGVVAGILGAGYAGMVFARSGREMRNALEGVDVTPTDNDVAVFRDAAEKMVSKLPAHFAITAVGFLTMIAGAAMP